MSGSASRHQRPDNSSSTLTTYDKQILSESPVFYLPLSGGSGGSADHSFNGHNGQAANMPALTTLPNGESASVFNGSNQYIEVPDHNALSVTSTGVITLEAWMRPDILQFADEEGSGYVHWMGKGVFGQNEYVARMYSMTNTENPVRPNRISGYCFNSTGGLGAGSYFQDGVSVGEWIHYVLVVNTLNTSTAYPTGYTKVYKNGAVRDQDALKDYNIVPTNGTSPFRIGTVDFNSYFQGAIAKVAMY
ncbi:MAG TPA: LamG-like jellyroll fold domain-containing protein, partial [Nitrosospira sp.]|nr:LamG-like jellyroll fold domain-containing protein [Nitrosospira sp.]